MSRNNRGRGHSRASGPPTKITKDFYTDAAVQKHVWNKVLSSPLTYVPGLATLILGGYVGLLNHGFLAVVALLIAAGVTVAATLIHRVLKGEEYVDEYFEEIESLRSRLNMGEVESIEEECNQVGFDEGSKEARELTEAYADLRKFLTEKRTKGRDMLQEQFKVQTEETYRKGVGILRQALQIFKAIKSIPIENFREEVVQYTRELTSLVESGGNGAQVAALKQKIKGHQDTIKLYEEKQDMIFRLLSKSNDLEQTLNRAYLQLSSMGHADPESYRESTSAQLDILVQAARQTEDELSGLGDDGFDDSEYLQAGQTKVSE